MSAILTPAKSAKQFRFYTTPNHLIHYTQSVLYKTKNYRNLVSQHLLNSQQENQILQTATKSKSINRIHRIYSRSISEKKCHKNQLTHSKKQAEDTQELQIVEALNRKGVFLRQTFVNKRIKTQKFAEQINEKILLQEKMCELKRKIYEERKLKEKTHLKNSKLINELDNSLKNAQLSKDQSRQNLTLICLLASDCSNLVNELEQVEKVNRKTLAIKAQQQNLVAQLETQIQAHRIRFDQSEDQFIQLKHLKTIQYKKMTIAYMKKNQLKEKKSLFLSTIKQILDTHS